MIRNDKADIIFRKGYEQAIKDGKKICEACATKGYYVREARKELLRDVNFIIENKLKQEQKHLNILLYPMKKYNVSICLNNLVVEIKQSLKELGEK